MKNCKKILSVLLAVLMALSMAVTAFGAIEVTDPAELEGFVPVKRAEDQLEEGDLYVTKEDFFKAFYTAIWGPMFSSLGDGVFDGDFTPYEELEDDGKASVDMVSQQYYYYQSPYTGCGALMYDPASGNLFLENSGDEFYGTIYTPDDMEKYVLTAIIREYRETPPETPVEPGEPDEPGAADSGNFFTNLWAKIVAFFQKIGDFFKNLFKK